MGLNTSAVELMNYLCSCEGKCTFCVREGDAGIDYCTSGGGWKSEQGKVCDRVEDGRGSIIKMTI